MRTDEILRIGPSVPGVVLRVLTVLVTVVCAATIGAPAVWIALAAALAAFGALLPAHGGSWLAAGVLAGALVMQGQDPARAAVVVASVHALHVLGTLSLIVPVTARISLRALLPTAIRFAAMQAVSQAALFTAMTIPSQGSSLPVAVIVGAIGVLVLALIMLRLLGRSRLDAFARRDRRSPSADAEPGVGGRSYT